MAKNPNQIGWYYNENNCIACRACEAGCKQEFDLSPTFHLDRLAQTAAESRRRLVEGRQPGRRNCNRRRLMTGRSLQPA